jgi:uncharacterized protein (DUF1778 family)
MAVNRKSNKEAIERLAMRVPAALKDKYTRAAELRGETFSGWAKHVLDEAAERQIREHEFTHMALADRIAFMESVQSPPQPTQAVVAAAKRYRKVFGI